VRVTIALQAFVPKPKTLFAREEMIGIRELEYRIGFVKRAVQGKARLTPTSPRWSWLDSVLVRGGALSAHAALHAYRSGGGFTAWRKAIAEVGLV
jgi:hypothetical protein